MTSGAYYCDHFVNRSDALDALHGVVAGQSSRRVIRVLAESGFGKSWLLQRLVDVCAEHNRPSLYIDFEAPPSFDRFAWEYGDVIEQFAAQMGVELFEKTMAAIREKETEIGLPSLPSPIDAPSGYGDSIEGQIEQKSVGQAIVGKGNIQANTLVLQAVGDGDPRYFQRCQREITDVFQEELAAAASVDAAVLMFDSWRRTDLTTLPHDTVEWLFEAVVVPTRDGRLGELAVVLADSVDDPRFAGAKHPRLAKLDIGPIPDDAVVLYLTDKRGINDPDIVKMICKICKGRPELMAMSADAHEPQF